MYHSGTLRPASAKSSALRKSGLRDAIDVLKGVDGISFTFFEAGDVVRHPLVARIVRAYDARDNAPAQDTTA